MKFGTESVKKITKYWRGKTRKDVLYCFILPEIDNYIIDIKQTLCRYQGYEGGNLMVKKICPICDQVMKLPHYCPNCRSWVREPYVREVTYYLNERHPEQESFCSYHDDAYSQAGTVQNRPLQNRPSQNRTLPNHPVQGRSVQNRPSQNRMQQNRFPQEYSVPNRSPLELDNNSSRDRKSSSSLGVTAIIMILAIAFHACGALGTSYKAVTNRTESLIDNTQYDVDLGTYTGDFHEEWEDEYQELTDAEVRAAGEACSSVAHFDILGPELVSPVMRILEEEGLEVSGTNTYSYNEVYDDGTTWYGTWTSLDLRDGGMGGYQYVELDYDTATGALHQIDITLEDKTILAEVTAEILELLGERDALPKGSEYAERVREELIEAAEREEGYQLEQGSLRVEGIAYDSCYCVTIMKDMIMLQE